MRHQKKTLKLGRKAEHRKALLANQVCSLIAHQRIKTTLAKAKAVRPLAERMVTLGKSGSLHARRRALSILRQKEAVKKLFDQIAASSAERNGGYTRIIKLGQRKSDSASMAFLEWVDAPKTLVEEKPEKPAEEKKAKRKEPEAKPKQKEKEPQKREEPTAKEKEKEPTAPPPEEPRPKKRRWFGKKSSEGDK
jgi:large subunit ribosomal protein L17